MCRRLLTAAWISLLLLVASMGNASEQAVIVKFHYGATDLGPMFALEDRLKKAIEVANVGEYDGNEIATDGSEGTLYMYGPDADRLYEVVSPILRKAPFMKGAEAIKRYGAPEAGVKAVRVTVAP